MPAQQHSSISPSGRKPAVTSPPAVYTRFLHRIFSSDATDTKNTTRQNGSTLIEVIVAMIILAVVTVGLNTGVVSLINSNINSKQLSTATTVGQEKFESFRRMDFFVMNALATSVDTVRSDYVRSWTMDQSDTTQTEIKLTVYWPLTSLKHNIDLSTIIARP